jgi:hypothetical protein
MCRFISMTRQEAACMLSATAHQLSRASHFGNALKLPLHRQRLAARIQSQARSRFLSARVETMSSRTPEY